MSADVGRAIRIFYSYAHEDKTFRDDLERHFATLRRLKHVITWYDRDILPGMEWASEISTQLDSADIILLLISSYFVDSDYCWGIEMKRALERHKAGEARVVPILLSPVDYDGTPIGDLLMLPTEGKAITRWSDREEALLDVVLGIRRLVRTLLVQKLLEDGYTYYQKNIFEEALSACENAMHLDPEYSAPYVLKGDILFTQRKYDDAFSAYEEAIKLDPDNELAYLGRGRVYDQLAQQQYEQTKRLADQSYEKARLLRSSKHNLWGDKQ